VKIHRKRLFQQLAETGSFAETGISGPSVAGNWHVRIIMARGVDYLLNVE
jgi:hypothetical protein